MTIEWTKELIAELLGEWGILLQEQMESDMKTNWWDKFKDFDTVDSFICTHDEIQRLEKTIRLHDALVSIPAEEIMELFKKHNIRYDEL